MAGKRVNSARGIPGPMPDWEREYLRGKVFGLIQQGYDDLEVARRSGVASRTVKRWRDEKKIANVYKRAAPLGPRWNSATEQSKGEAA